MSNFKIYQYTAQAKETYPNGGGTEISIGSKVDGKQVKDIIWPVHLANKKANCWVLENPSGNYPKSFPDDSFPDLYCPAGNIATLGESQTDTQGRLLALGGYGSACAWDDEAAVPSPLGDDRVVTLGVVHYI